MEELLEKFLKFERDNNLLDQKIDNIYFWSIIRRRISDNILKDNGLISSAEYTTGNNKFEQISFFLHYLFNAFKNVFKKIPKVDYIIINHPRKVLNNGKYMDIYSYYLQEDLLKNNENFLVIDVPINWHKHLIEKKSYIRNMENFTIIKKIFYKFIYKNKYKNNEFLKEISNKLKKEFNSDGNLMPVVSAQLGIFKADYKYYKKFFKKASPKEVSIVISEVYPGIVKAAKDLGITTVEIQHAAIAKDHLAYEYPYSKNAPYFPEKMRLFGWYWYDIMDLPVSRENIILTENKYLSEQSSNLVKKNDRQVLFVTQGWITNKMLDIIDDFCKKNKSYKIVVKLHPSEYEIWKKVYPKLQTMQKKYNLVVVDNFDKGIYDWLNESKYVVGVSSTCLYEALFFNCSVHLLNLPSVEIMNELVKKNIVSLSNNANELLDNMQKFKNAKIDLNYIYYQGGKK